MRDLQAAVDDGHQPWRVSAPDVAAACTFGIPGTAVEPAGENMFRVTQLSTGQTVLVTLVQPLISEGGLVWAVTSVVPVEGAVPSSTMVVSPSEGPPFTVVTVAGVCTGPSPHGVGELESSADADGQPGGTGAIPGANAVFFLTPDANGFWMVSFTVPPVVPPGQYQVVAWCYSGEIDRQPLEYTPQPFEVSAGGSASMSVSPLQAPAGVDVVLDVFGTLCQGVGAEVEVLVTLAGAQEGGEFVANGFFAPDSEGNWSGQVTIPAGPAATYVVGAVCNVDGVQFFTYPPYASPSGSIPSSRLVEIQAGQSGLPPTR